MKTWEIMVLLVFALLGVVNVLVRAIMSPFPVSIVDVVPKAIGGAIGGLILGIVFISIVKAIKRRGEKKATRK